MKILSLWEADSLFFFGHLGAAEANWQHNMDILSSSKWEFEHLNPEETEHIRMNCFSDNHSHLLCFGLQMLLNIQECAECSADIRKHACTHSVLGRTMDFKRFFWLITALLKMVVSSGENKLKYISERTSGFAEHVVWTPAGPDL